MFFCNIDFRLGERQIQNLLKIAKYSKDKNLKETTQAEMKEQCLALWKVSTVFIIVYKHYNACCSSEDRPEILVDDELDFAMVLLQCGY